MMYGTIAKVCVKPGKIEELKQWTERFESPPGGVAISAYQMDADPSELYIAVLFESREAYVANAESPEQHEQYLQMLQLLEGEPEWHDGEIVSHRQF